MADTFEASIEHILKEAKILTDFFSEHGYYSPAFNQGGFNEFEDLPDQIETARRSLQIAAKTLHDLAAGPGDFVKSLAKNYHDTSSLRWLVHFKIPEAVPLRGSIPYNKVAAACNVDEAHLRRIVRYAATNHLFTEIGADEIAHTAYSAVLVTDEEVRTSVDLSCEELFPTSAKLVEAHETWPMSDTRTRTAFQLAWDTTLPIDNFLAQPGLEERAALFKQAADLPESDIQHLIDGFDWGQVKRVVDVGGGDGEAAIALARNFPNLRIMLEDQPEILENSKTVLPAELAHKVYPVAHDFFKPQPDEVSGAEVYLLQHLLHQYSDKHALQILDNLVELLQDGAKLVIVDAIMDSPNSPSPLVERYQRSLDLEIMQTHNGKERQLDEWRSLLREVDTDLEIVAVRQPAGSASSIMEVVLMS